MSIVAGRSFRCSPPLLIDLAPFLLPEYADVPAWSTMAVLAVLRLSPLTFFVPFGLFLPFLADFRPPFDDTSPLLGIVPMSAGCGSGNAGTGTGREIGTGAVAGPGAATGLEHYPRGNAKIIHQAICD